MKMLLVFAAIFYLLPAVHAQQKPAADKPVFTSVYTDLRKQCKATRETASTEGSDPAARCTGYGGYRIFMYYSATSATLGVQRVADGADVMELGTDYGSYGSRGEKVEWRMANGKPFAVIFRQWKYRGEGADGTMYSGTRVGSRLLVKGLPGWERISAEVDGTLADANARARAAADAGWAVKK